MSSFNPQEKLRASRKRKAKAAAVRKDNARALVDEYNKVNGFQPLPTVSAKKRETAKRIEALTQAANNLTLSGRWDVIVAVAGMMHQRQSNGTFKHLPNDFALSLFRREMDSQYAEIYNDKTNKYTLRTDIEELFSRVLTEGIPETLQGVTDIDELLAPRNIDTGDKLEGIGFLNHRVVIDPYNGKIELRYNKDEMRHHFDVRMKSYPYVETTSPPEFTHNWLVQTYGEDGALPVWETMGAAITFSFPKLQQMPMFTGIGGSGKGTTIKLIRKLLGNDRWFEMNAISSLASSDFAMQHANETDFFVFSDAEAASTSPETRKGLNMIKNFGGGGTPKTNVKNGDYRQIHSALTFMFALNDISAWITSPSEKEAWERRLRIHSANTPVDKTKVVPSFEDKCIEHDGRGAIAGYAIHCYAQAIARSSDPEVVLLTVPPKSEQVFEEIVESSKDDYTLFVEGMVQVKAGQNVPSNKLLDAFKNVTGKAANARNLARAMRQAGYEHKRSNGSKWLDCMLTASSRNETADIIDVFDVDLTQEAK